MQEINMSGESMNIVEENIEKLKSIFPEVFNEDKIDFDKLQNVLGNYIDTDEEKYRFTWNGKMNALRLSQTPSVGTLRPCKEESRDWDTTQNLYIEGDNLEVLKLLQNSYLNKIKIIYIDPPYNTGKDFVYTDDTKDNLSNYKKLTKQIDSEGNSISTNSETSGRYHTNWLNLMYPRLRLARNLLTDDGIIFISIDDNEVNNLQKICDEIFGEDNFISILSVENNPKGRKNSDFVAISNEFCLIYAKNKKLSGFIENIPKNVKDLAIDENGQYVHNSGKRVLVGENNFNAVVTDFTSDKHYSVYYNKEKNDIILKQEFSINEVDSLLITDGYKRFISYHNDNFTENTYTKNKLLDLFGNMALDFKENKIYEKNFSTTKRIKSCIVNEKYNAVLNGSEAVFEIDVKTTSAGTYLKELFNVGDSIFSAPKNIGLIKLFLTLFEDKNYTVLDFFSGSATTADAIMRQNLLDNGNRKYICVQLQEDLEDSYKIASGPGKATIKNAIEYLKSNNKPLVLTEIGKKRIELVGDSLQQELNNNIQLNLNINQKILPDIGFKVFKLDSSNIKKWNPDTSNIKQALFDSINNFVDGRSEEDALYEIILKSGLPLTVPVEELEIKGKKVYSIGFGAMIVCLANDITLDVADEIAQISTEFEDKSQVTVVFKDNSFRDDSIKTNIKETLKGYGIGKFVTI